MIVRGKIARQICRIPPGMRIWQIRGNRLYLLYGPPWRRKWYI